MKGLVLLFLSISLGIIAWRYAPEDSKTGIKKVIRDNLMAIVLAFLAVSIAVVVSTNTTLRLV